MSESLAIQKLLVSLKKLVRDEHSSLLMQKKFFNLDSRKVETILKWAQDAGMDTGMDPKQCWLKRGRPTKGKYTVQLTSSIK